MSLDDPDGGKRLERAEILDEADGGADSREVLRFRGAKHLERDPRGRMDARDPTDGADGERSFEATDEVAPLHPPFGHRLVLPAPRGVSVDAGFGRAPVVPGRD